MRNLIPSAVFACALLSCSASKSSEEIFFDIFAIPKGQIRVISTNDQLFAGGASFNFIAMGDANDMDKLCKYLSTKSSPRNRSGECSGEGFHDQAHVNIIYEVNDDYAAISIFDY